MEHYLAITTLNDFIFCPYSIYLHQIYDFNNEETYHDEYQSKGKRLHDFIDNNKDVESWKNAYVYSEKLGIYGKIDDYNPATKELIEYKSTIAIAFKGYYYQIWAQYLCMTEMGVKIEKMAFFDVKTNASYFSKSKSNLKYSISKTSRFSTPSNFCSFSRYILLIL